MLEESQKNVLKKVVNTLNDNGIAFGVSGGLGAIAYGATRPLYDIDIDVPAANIQQVRELFKQYIVHDFYHFTDQFLDIHLLTLLIDGVGVDVTQCEEVYFTGKAGRKVRMDTDLRKVKIVNIEGIEVPAQDKSELIAYKTIIARDIDLKDIEEMLK